MTTTITKVATAIQHACAVIEEWDTLGHPWNAWREDQTRYAIIDPILRALGWDTADPKECSIEHFIRDAKGNRGWADYALFRGYSVEDLAGQKASPSVLVEAKALRTPLDPHEEQIERYILASRMTEGMAVLTNGNEWWLYHVSSFGSSVDAWTQELDITTVFGRHIGADTLCQCLAR